MDEPRSRDESPAPPPDGQTGSRVHTGRRFEDVAATHLTGQGLRILAANYRDGPREIDLIARDGRTLVFVEVKGRSRLDRGHPLESIDARKRRDVERAARRWLREHPGQAGPGGGIRFDAVAVVPAPSAGSHAPRGGGWSVEHVPDAWRPGCR